MFVRYFIQLEMQRSQLHPLLAGVSKFSVNKQQIPPIFSHAASPALFGDLADVALQLAKYDENMWKPATGPSLASAGESRADIMGQVVLGKDAMYGGAATHD